MLFLYVVCVLSTSVLLVRFLLRLFVWFVSFCVWGWGVCVRGKGVEVGGWEGDRGWGR